MSTCPQVVTQLLANAVLLVVAVFAQLRELATHAMHSLQTKAQSSNHSTCSRVHELGGMSLVLYCSSQIHVNLSNTGVSWHASCVLV